jgi:hypothetical protein
VTPDEQARLADAIAMLNTTFGPYGVNIVLVDATTPGEDIRVHDSNNTPAGGMAQGILGYADPSGDLYIVNNWTWYTASDPRGISSAQYDYQTVISHELGHGIGLEHSSDSGSVMYGLLNPGVTRRSFTAFDLSNLVAGGLLSNDSDHRLTADGDALPAGGTDLGKRVTVLGTAQTVPGADVGSVKPEPDRTNPMVVASDESRGRSRLAAVIIASSQPSSGQSWHQAGMEASQGLAVRPNSLGPSPVSATDELFRSLGTDHPWDGLIAKQAQAHYPHRVRSGFATLGRGQAVLEALFTQDEQAPGRAEYQVNAF